MEPTPTTVNLPEGCPPLASYYFYLTGGCNLACQHCWLAPAFQPHGTTGGHLDFALFEQAIREGIPLGLSHSKLTGGEPLLHPDFIRIVDLLKANNITMTIETNGTLLDRKIARHFKEKSTLTSISVSLDGATAESHDAFRGVKGTYEKATNAVRYLVEEGYRPQVIMSIHKGNLTEVEALCKLAESLGAGSVKLAMVQSSGRGEKMEERDLTLSMESLLELGEWVDTYLQPRISIPLYYNWPPAFFSLKKLLNFNAFSCQAFNILGVLDTGHLAMCGIGALVPELCYGRLGEDSVYDVWTSSPKLLELRQTKLASEGICGECVFSQRCLGTCVAQNYQLADSLTAPYWFCQEADAMGRFPASRKKHGPTIPIPDKKS
jgi:SynChlorMet cassette radical SAM/SPASM protein ScmF